MFKNLFVFLANALFALDFVTVEIQGQLGNQLFQIATATAYAIDHGCEARFPSLKNAINAHLNHRYVFPSINTDPILEEPLNFSETAYNIFSPIPYESGKSICLNGYFQFEKYFAHHRKTIEALFAPAPNILEEIHFKYGSLLEKKCVGIHVRTFFPDAIDPNLGVGRTDWTYYIRAIEEFPEDTFFLVFSDAPEWVKAHFPKIRKNIAFIEDNPHYFDFYLMSQCAHLVIAPRSTFSWWAAWLNPNPDKIVIRSDIDGLPDEAFPSSWRKIAAR